MENQSVDDDFKIAYKSRWAKYKKWSKLWTFVNLLKKS